MVEMFAPVMAMEALGELLRGRQATILVDSECVEGALVRGYSGREDMCELVGLFWHLAAALGTAVYIDRLHTDANPADGPS